jgi:hypothetical protein
MSTYIIHPKANDTIATRIHFALSLAHITNWVDHIHASEHTVEAAQENLEAFWHSDTVIFVLSEKAVLSRKCIHQLDAALDHSKRLIVAIAEPFPADDLPLRLWDNSTPYVDLTTDLNHGIVELIRAVAGEVSS